MPWRQNSGCPHWLNSGYPHWLTNGCLQWLLKWTPTMTTLAACIYKTNECSQLNNEWPQWLNTGRPQNYTAFQFFSPSTNAKNYCDMKMSSNQTTSNITDPPSPATENFVKQNGLQQMFIWHTFVLDSWECKTSGNTDAKGHLTRTLTKYKAAKKPHTHWSIAALSFMKVS